MYGFNSDRSKVEVPKIYTSSTAPQEGSAGDLWLKVYSDEAYAVFDSSDGSLTIFRDEVGKYTNGQVIGTKTYYAGIEDITGSTGPKWGVNSELVTKVIIEDTFKPKTAYQMFYVMTRLTEIEGMKNLDTSDVTNMEGMFSGCIGLTFLDLSNFNTSNIISMEGMFYGCANLTTTLNIMKMPTNYTNMCKDTARDSGQLTLKYTAPVTSADIDLLVATKNDGNVVNGGLA